MFTPTFEQFKKFAAQGNLIPVYRESLADLDTPVSVFSRFADDRYAFLLESVEGGEQWGRYSFIGIQPQTLFTVADGKARLHEPSGVRDLPVPAGQPPLFALRAILKQHTPVQVPGLPRFFGGAVGYLGYESVRSFEPRLPAPKNDPGVPEACFVFADQLAIFDNVRHTVKVVVCARLDGHASVEHAYNDACRRIEAIEARLRTSQPAPLREPKHHLAEPVPNQTKDGFCRAIEKIKEYILNGDIIQAVYSQRFETELPASPLTVYRALRLINPSPYTFFLKMDEHMLIGSSPEVLVRLTGDVAETRPIAGTRPRGATEQEDRDLADELLRDEKERAEHVMLVDLGRNDLGRVATTGSVQVKDFMTVERYSHVMHIVSNVQGILKPGLDAFDLLASAFPAGTLSGAPKIRAMEIIHELEPGARGVYGGAVGYFAFDGSMDLAITIRTLEVRGRKVFLQVGAGIVADSEPEREYEETLNKGRGMFRALHMAANGLEITPKAL